MANKETVAKGIAYLFSMYPRDKANMDPSSLVVMVDGWSKHFADVDGDLFMNAIEQHVASSKFFPAVAEIRERAFGLQRHAEGGDIDPTEAFGVVMQMASARGRDATEDERRRYLADRLPGRVVDITMATIKALGWQAICNEDLSRVDTLRAQWRGCFNAIQKRNDDLSAMSPTVRAFIAELAQKFTIDSARLQSPKRDEFENDDETF